MGQQVFVLTTLMSSKDDGKTVKEWRPVAVVTSADAANQWSAQGGNNDWIPLELDDLSLTDLADKSVTLFQPKQMPAADTQMVTTMQSLRATNESLFKIVEQLATKMKDKNLLKIIKDMRTEQSQQEQKPSKRMSSSLLKKREL